MKELILYKGEHKHYNIVYNDCIQTAHGTC